MVGAGWIEGVKVGCVVVVRGRMCAPSEMCPQTDSE